MPVPFAGEEFTFHDPDGAEVRVRGWGDQYAAVFETLDGFTVVQHPDTGYYHIATLSEDKTRLVPTAERAATADTQVLSMPKHLRTTREAVREEALRAHDEPGVQRRWETRRAQRRARRRESPESESDPEAEPLQPVTVGNYVGLCILIQFPDVTGTISQQEVDNFCNQQGYSNFSNNGSVYDYFLDNSGGVLHYTNIVTAYYTSQQNRAHYTDPQIPVGTRARELIIEALDDLQNQGFDFSPLSADGSGFIYALNVFYAGPVVNNWSEGLWPHSWALASPYVLPGNKRFSDYQITNMGSQLTLRTFCHENGHMICDFPDLYDYGGQSHGVGHFCLMCYGGSNVNPVQVCGYLKAQAGWAASLTTITPGMSATVSSTSNDFYVHRKSNTEYFIIENRQQAGRDTALPDAGLAIWHADEMGSNQNEQMTSALHYECSLEQADGRFDLEHKANTGDSEDLFSAPTATAFGDSSGPDSRWWDGGASGLDLEQISASGTTMTFNTTGGGMAASIVGTWNVIAVDWGCQGSVLRAAPFTFNSNGTWTYAFGGGNWIQVGGMAAWNFSNAAGLIYTANVSIDAMVGIMGYATGGSSSTGCFYALRNPSPAPAPGEEAATPEDIATGPAPSGGTGDPVVGPPEG
jgi:M6 family metalloprotease-like protein